jgi:hypothetical protein
MLLACQRREILNLTDVHGETLTWLAKFDSAKKKKPMIGK